VVTNYLVTTVVIMPREGTLRYDNGRWRPMRERRVAWLPIGWRRGRAVVWCHAPVLELDPESLQAPWMVARCLRAVEHAT
jgi:hypothetical protein